ncbi:hypothetical protein LTR53_013266 [Teratosphaeriaceae sp. CCFEE 6253]|nr:hypothetical protein LTR53_013266 [Teratosphaeriaceae sp. CCFEE 6253]
MDFFAFPREVRNMIYFNSFSDVAEVRIKPFVAYKKPNVPLCRQTYHEVHDELVVHALQTTEAKFVVEVVDFDFRTANNLLEYVRGRRDTFGLLIDAAEPKLVVDLTITNARSIDQAKLGRWLGARQKDPSVMIEYRASRGGEIDEVLNAMWELETAFLALGGEITRMTRAVVERVQGLGAIMDGRQADSGDESGD